MLMPVVYEQAERAKSLLDHEAPMTFNNSVLNEFDGMGPELEQSFMSNDLA